MMLQFRERNTERMKRYACVKINQNNYLYKKMFDSVEIKAVSKIFVALPKKNIFTKIDFVVYHIYSLDLRNLFVI